MVAKGGAALAPINAGTCPGGVPAGAASTQVDRASEAEIESGLFRVDINEAQPAGSTTVRPAEPSTSAR